MKVIISAGGTGGHIYPALAILDKIKEKEKDVEILYIGTTDRMEKDIVPSFGYNYVGIDIDGLYRKFNIKNIRSLYLFIKAVNKCEKIINDFKPDIIIGVGGYISAPVCYAAHKKNIKCVIHEQNSILGITNKFASRFADKIFLSFESSKKYVKDQAKVVYTGNPCSEKAYNIKPCDKKKFGLDPNKKLVLIVMGSLGSKTVNDKMKKQLTLFNNKEYEVLFVTGKNYYKEYKNKKYASNIHVVSYIDNMISLLKVTNCLVSRAGASTLSEIAALKVPSILIPSPYVTENHQYLNAMDLVNKNSALILEEKDLKGDNLLRLVEKIINNSSFERKIKNNLKEFQVKDSATKIYNEIKILLKKENSK